jgi:hypothetical protein
MSSSLFFQEDALGVVDDWLGDVSSGDDDADMQRGSSRAPINISESSLVKNFKKARNNKALSKYANSGVAGSESEDEDYDDLGGAGNKMPASRTSAVDSKKVAGNKRKLVVIASKESEAVKPTATAIAKAAAPDSAVKNVQLNKEGAGAGVESDGAPKRKKTKTRSKQKNIRRDNRTEAVKPEHLQYSSESYAGRPLTEKTIVVLEDKYSKMQQAMVKGGVSRKGKGANAGANVSGSGDGGVKKPATAGGQKGSGSWKKGEKGRQSAPGGNKGGSVKSAGKAGEGADLGWSLDTSRA